MDSVLNVVTRTHQGLAFNSLHFLVFCLIAVPVVRLAAATAARRWALLLLNAYFFVQIVTGWAPAAFLGALVLFTYACGEFRIRYGHRLPYFAVPAVVLLLWGVLFAVKDPVLASVANPFRHYQLLFIGFSYIIFRCIQYLMDVEAFEERSLLTLINFLLFFPTLFAGPLERYETFQQFHDGKAGRDGGPVLPGLHRIATGLIKKYVLADNLMAFGFFAMAPHEQWPAPLLWIGVLSQLALLYLDFSGYCDLAVGLSRLMGLPLVENFDRPWLARDLQDFWNRWNISLSSFFKDYFFTPLSHLVFYYAGPRLQVILISAIYFTTMVLIALWHGLTMGFLVFGVLHGFALVLSQLLRKVSALSRGGSPATWVRGSLSYALVVRGFLYCFISLSLVFGYCGVREALRIFSAMVGY